ncbi:hypothetical protein [Variovorax sp. OV700]|uniref:hypothetical protein n=1 Tax=Variovorax sp. OV700 TaxID=1882826 RepID=UPI00088DE2B8|nr:hypothetical protein [Variovorax sp. OV700]SDJ78381.1 hypothetical protein SAMN05444748_12239 [Variovorax sp. OV700]
MTPIFNPPSCRRVGSDDQHYFFGYYNKSNWDHANRLVLALQVPWSDRELTPDLVAGVGYFDTQDGDRFVRVAETGAWNWQMGAQLQWLDNAPGQRIIYNVRTAATGLRYPGFGSEICDILTGEKRSLPMPVYVTASNSKWALCVNYRRLWVTHQTIGYSADQDTPPEGDLAKHPADDGIYRMDLAGGAAELVVSYQALRDFQPRQSMEKALHWVSHIEINPASSRILFLHRWTERVADETCFLHRLITMNPDGSDMRLLECSDHPLPQLADDFDPSAVGTFDYEKSEYQISHPLWQDNTHIVVWGPHLGEIHYHLYTDAPDGDVQVIGKDVLTENGHMSFSPASTRWLLSDTYPDARTHQRALFIYDMQTGQRVDIGRFYTSPDLSKENRCDLHPRWSRDGRQVCIDSIHDGERRIYILDPGLPC